MPFTGCRVRAAAAVIGVVEGGARGCGAVEDVGAVEGWARVEVHMRSYRGGQGG